MNFFHTNRLIFWVLIILVVINISALASFFLFKETPGKGICCSPEEQQCSAFRDELKLTAAQSLKVAEINKTYKQSAGPIATAIKETRAAILTELENETPDTTHLNGLVSQLSLLQLKIQKENIKQYVNLKHVCTPEQANRLSALYRDLYGCPMQNGQMNPRYRHGQGNGKKQNCE